VIDQVQDDFAQSLGLGGMFGGIHPHHLIDVAKQWVFAGSLARELQLLLRSPPAP
jgi:hypothetical protein